MSKQCRLPEDLAESLKGLIAKECSGFYAGPVTGPDIDLHFGRKTTIVVPVSRPSLPEGLKLAQGEISLFIECAWRLDSEREVICGSTDSNENDGPMQRGLALIVGRAVKSVKVELPAGDLTVRFDGDIALRVFCDQTNLEEGNDNYSLHVKDRIYIVGPRGRLRYELRTNDGAR